MFTPEARERVRADVLALARADPRVVSGAVLGSEASGTADRWSDLDLTFGLREDASPEAVLDEWTERLSRSHHAVALFDVTQRSTRYRVLLFPGNLQVDVSVTPGAAAQYGPRFRRLFGEAFRAEAIPPRSAREAFGYAVHHAVRAAVSIERGRPWQAEHWLRGLRDEALALACLRRGIDAAPGRGLDRLPSGVLDAGAAALARSPEPAELRRALARGITLLLAESEGLGPEVERLASGLRALSGAPGR